MYKYTWIRSVIICLLLASVEHGLAQKSSLEGLIDSVEGHTKKWLSEKLYVHTDKVTYIAGDILWLKLYVVDDILHRPVDVSKVGYVELLDKENRPVAQVKIALNHGEGAGSVQVPFAVHSGYYILQAYTSWMKNFSPEFFFQKTISVINTLQSGWAVADSKGSARVDFFPEGGNLIQDLQTKVGVKVIDKDGRPVHARGVVYNEQGDTIVRFETLRFGLGNFVFHPAGKHTYRATLVLDDGASFTKAIPDIYPGGYVLNLVRVNEEQVQLSIQCSMAQRQQPVYLLVNNGQVVKLARQLTLKSGVVDVLINKSEFGDGVNRITLFDHQKQPVCERLYFKKPMNTFIVDIDGQRNYGQRRKVTLHVGAKDMSGGPVSTDLSLSVYRVDSLSPMDPVTIQNYLFLTSDLKGKVDSPAYYFSNAPDVDEATDNLVLTHGWRRFKWKDILAGTGVPVFLPECKAPVVTVRMVERKTGDAAPGQMVLLSVPESAQKLIASVTDSTGVARFEVKDYYGPGVVYIRAGSNDSLYRITIASPFTENYGEQSLPPFTLGKEYRELLEKYSISMQSQYVYNESHILKFAIPPVTDTFPFYGKGYYDYPLDDYTRFSTMEEVLREFVKPIYVSMKGGRLNLKIFNEDRKLFDQENELIMVNGIPIPDKNRVFSYNPMKFKRIEVIPNNFFIGRTFFSGVADFQTYNDQLDEVDLDPNLLVIDYDGVQLQREFYVPQYDSQEQLESRIPDLRKTLYWNPDVPTTVKGPAIVSFFTGDEKGKFIVIAEGINSYGATGVGYFTINVQ